MPNLIMLVGLPGSGKSTWRANFLKEHPWYVSISMDDYVEKCAAEAGTSYNQVWALTVKKAERVMKEELAQALEEKQDIIWDQTNVSRQQRKKKLAALPKDYMKKAVFFLTSFKILDSVNEERKKIGRAIPDNVMKSMQFNLEVPLKSEGFYEVEIIERL